MLSVKVNTPINDYDGQPLKTEDGRPFTFLIAVRNALNSSVQGEDISGDQKMKYFELSLKLGKADKVDLTLDEAAMIKERAGKVLASPLVYGTIAKILESSSENASEQ